MSYGPALGQVGEWPGSTPDNGPGYIGSVDESWQGEIADGMYFGGWIGAVGTPDVEVAETPEDAGWEKPKKTAKGKKRFQKMAPTKHGKTRFPKPSWKSNRTTRA